MSSFGNDVSLVPAGTVLTASASPVTGGTVIHPVNKATFRGALVVSAASGTSPSLTIGIQTSYDNGVTDSWHTVASFPAATAAGTTRLQVPGCDRYIRAIATISGTSPSFTFGLTGEMV